MGICFDMCTEICVDMSAGTCLGMLTSGPLRIVVLPFIDLHMHVYTRMSAQPMSLVVVYLESLRFWPI